MVKANVTLIPREFKSQKIDVVHAIFEVADVNVVAAIVGVDVAEVKLPEPVGDELDQVPVAVLLIVYDEAAYTQAPYVPVCEPSIGNRTITALLGDVFKIILKINTEFVLSIVILSQCNTNSFATVKFLMN